MDEEQQKIDQKRIDATVKVILAFKQVIALRPGSVAEKDAAKALAKLMLRNPKLLKR